MTSPDLIDCAELDGELEQELGELGDQPEEEDGLPPGYLSKNFRETELACNHCGSLGPQGIHPVLVEVLEDVRNHFGVPVIVTSGYRCPTHNANVGGARFSQHKRGTAADIRVKGVHPTRVHQYLSAVRGSKGGLGLYSTFVHVDVGPDGRRWKG